MLYKATDENIITAGEMLKNGRIVAIPTETVYGLAANALDADAVRRIFEAKGRPADNPLIVHIADISELEKYAYPTEEAYRLAEKFWPGPMTLVLKRKPVIPDIVTAGLDSVAIRFPSHKIANAIIKAAGVPLAAPSANVSGKPSPTEAKHVVDDFGDKIDAVIDGGKCECGVESTVISLVGEVPVLLRPGFVTAEQLRQFIPGLKIAQAVMHRLPENEKALSPGLKHRHYAPSAATEGVRGTTINAVKYIESRCYKGLKTAVMCFDGEEKLFSGATPFPYGKEDMPQTLANELFAKLREIDKLGFDKIFIRFSGSAGVGLAVCNRLLRACAFNVTDADKLNIFVLGLTGQSGAGKSYIAGLFEKYGFVHIDADAISREIVPGLLDELVTEFGSSVKADDETLNRGELARLAFSSPERTAALNRITHTAITDRADELIDEYARSGATRIVLDGAALIEAGADRMCNKTACVIADENTRLERVMARDGISAEKGLERFGAQKPQYFYTDATDFIITNNGDDVEEQVAHIVKIIERAEAAR